MSASHTPGPWHVARGLYGDKDGFSVWGPRFEGGGYPKVCDVDGIRNREADANLIAAAPELLKVLQRYIDGYDPECPPDDMPDAGCIECTVGTVPNDRNTGLCKYHQARAAITKATAP